MSDVELPTTRYVRSGDISIAYQTMGHGSVDLIIILGVLSHVEFMHEIFPGWTDLLRRLAAFARVVTFDKRGQGLSDRMPGVPLLEERMDDVSAIMEAIGSKRAVLVGISEGAPMSALFAATYPERVSHLVLWSGFARFTNTSDFSLMFPEEAIFRLVKHYGTGAFIKAVMPSGAHDPVLVSQFAKFERLSASPGAFKALLQQNALIDVRPILANVRVPTLVLHSLKDRLVPVENGRYLASQIPGAKYIEYPDGAHGFFECDVPKLCGEIEEFVTGKRESQQHNFERVLATVLFTDIVDSTNRAVQMGDHSWRSLLDEHDRMARRIIERYRGQLVKTTGDGILATFDGPGRAIHCALDFEAAAAQIDLPLRAGLHAGGKLKSGTRISAASQFTRQHASWPFLTRAKFWFRE
ncbi:adenylate/guanylate cyclase domain-containing protein [Bradyrhizobium sp. 195]|uniref:adenylate/guanylate cyclase domain-containing protein n=1 Tax=Bradyrhizobium sp. 195 TaxID=2782662 RepID=UPI002000D8DE|nr:adenylate/guanylate cyclase domain-containing protein [Bradyrhizobium sp. 195]